MKMSQYKCALLICRCLEYLVVVVEKGQRLHVLVLDQCTTPRALELSHSSLWHNDNACSAVRISHATKTSALITQRVAASITRIAHIVPIQARRHKASMHTYKAEQVE